MPQDYDQRWADRVPFPNQPETLIQPEFSENLTEKCSRIFSPERSGGKLGKVRGLKRRYNQCCG